ncbi:MAG: hypothetical protein B7W98_01535 [Parcubacteria group bacterium 20-58-5]|nr:MAG: hypothetical protein B7W98_01535 [Parcubacteria group bacterium 20-58-5]OYV63842.1 MAG: hypothetical protein B7X03_00175 [Parcubacteria group bacterium 21-58-10]
MRGALTVLTLISVVFFPWPFAALLALVCAFTEPLVPLAAGLFADTLYYAPQAHTLPLATLCGALVTAAAFFVRSRLRAGTMRG